jgi:glycosyltransferase involved in cell wall biosynthesis
VAYPPYDEDFGYVTLEAFLAAKPVITCTDSGGPLEFVRHEVNGWVCEPAPEALAAAFSAAQADRTRTASLGSSGYDLARTISWDGVIERLVG